MSRAFHNYVRDTLGPRRDFAPPVVYNSWYATLFDVNAEGQAALEADLLALLRSQSAGGEGLVVPGEYLETVITR